MDKALRGQGCVMKRQKKSIGGAMRDMPENLKEYLDDNKIYNDNNSLRRKINKEVPKRKRPKHK